MDTIADWLVLGEGAGDQLGTSVAGAGDVNGDGHLDVVIGAPYRNLGSTIDVGAAYVFYGGPLLDVLPDYVIEGIDEEENLGRSVSGCGDASGSGYDHVLAGAPGGVEGGSDVGRIVLSPGGDPPLDSELVSFYGENTDDQLGFAVAGGAGLGGLSFTGDPRPDMATGAWRHGLGGRAYLYGIYDDLGVPSEGAAAAKVFPPVPNPVESTAEIAFDVPQGGEWVKLRVFDASGRLVATLADGPAAPGHRTTHWDLTSDCGLPVASGVYFVKYETDTHSSTEKLILVR
jgi:hypothetical protein